MYPEAKLTRHSLLLLAVVAVLVLPGSAWASGLHAAILPNELGHLDFAENQNNEYLLYATIINDTEFDAENCRIELQDDLPFKLRFWATEPAQNRIVAPQDEPADIAAKSNQSFRFTLELLSAQYLLEQRLNFAFLCDTHTQAPRKPGINTVLLSAGTPDVLMAMATPDADNRVILTTQLGDQECVGRLRYRAEPVPCAVGTMALAMLNNSAEALDLVLDVESDGPQGVICRTNLSGQCQSIVAPLTGFEFRLEADEIATFSAFLLTFRDEYFGYVTRPRKTGFVVSAIDPQTHIRKRFINQTFTELVSPAFEWSAKFEDNQLQVRGSVAVPNSCSYGRLELATSSDASSAEVHLDLRQATDDPFAACLQVIGQSLVTWSSEGPVADIERVIVRFQTDIPLLQVEPLVLSVQR